MDWLVYDNGNSIGKVGSESGIIIKDIEHISGARITIEKDGSIAPFSVTLGIYGLMFHTQFARTIEEVNKYLDFAQYKIQEIFHHYEIPEELRDNHWQNQLSEFLKELSEQS